jgi:hypothetical protein
MTDYEISVKGSRSVNLLSETKRFTLYSNSIKSSPRFKRIVEQFHTEDESLPTIKALITSLKNFELSNSGSEQLTQERRKNRQWKRDLKSYLDIILKRDQSTDEIPTKEEKSNAGESFQPRNQSEVRDDGDILRCINHPSSKAHWTSKCNGGKKPAFTPKIKDKSSTPSTGCSFCFANLKLTASNSRDPTPIRPHSKPPYEMCSTSRWIRRDLEMKRKMERNQADPLVAIQTILTWIAKTRRK